MFFVVDWDKEVSAQQAARAWRQLWELRNIAPVNALLPASVMSPCPLLPEEAVEAVHLPTLSLVPADTAWVSFEIDLLDYADARGELRLATLETALSECVNAGERGHDTTGWANSHQSHDSCMNRRLAVFVRGWGDLVEHRQDDPTSLPVLGELEQLVHHVEAVLTNASRAIASRAGYCPAIDAAGARVQHHGNEMALRWQRAVRNNALRHRNLLTLSPWDVFPRHGDADPRFMNLLPLLRRANSVSFHRNVEITRWQVSEFRSFYERVGAILRRSGDASLIAHQV